MVDVSRTVLAALLLASAAVLRAHPEIEAALQRISASIAATPGRAVLYLERGELYARHADALAAEANYLRAAELDPTLPGLDHARAALAYDTGDFAGARLLLDRVLRRESSDVAALLLRGRTCAKLGERDAALRDYTAALSRQPVTAPEIYLELAALQPEARTALLSLETGLAHLGAVPALELRALELEEKAGLLSAALARLDRLADSSERPESWLIRRGDLLRRAGRTEEARQAYRQAQQAIARLPDWLRDAPDTVRQIQQLRSLAGEAAGS